MGPVDKVVVGVDGSERSNMALRWAVERLDPDGRLDVVYALDPSSELVLAALQQDSVPLRHRAERDLAGPWSEPARAAGLAPRCHVVEDDPSNGLLRVAEQQGATLVVVGSHGAGGRHRPFVGSLTRNILHHATIPVVVVSSERAETVGPDIVGPDTVGPDTVGHDKASRHHPVVVGVSYGPASDRAAAWASDYAAARDRPLHLLHTVSYRPVFPIDSPVDTLGSFLGPEVTVNWATADLDGMRDQILARHPGLDVSTRVEVGSAVRALIDAGVDAEVVVVGKRQGDQVLRRTISPRLRQLIARASCPTAVVPSCPAPPS